MNAEHYNELVEREDSLCSQIQTCQTVLQKVLDCIYEQGAALHKQTVEEALLALYDIEHGLQVDLLLLRMERYIVRLFSTNRRYRFD